MMEREQYIMWAMVFLHIVDDFYLQGILASLKQKKFWQENAPDKMYKHDYICALFMHAFSWTFMIMLPIAYVQGFDMGRDFIVAFGINLAIHALVDDQKANRHTINLCQDQAIHLMQICATAWMFL